MPTSHDFDGTIRRIAAAAITAGDMFSDGTDKVTGLALTTAAVSGTFTAKVIGRVNGVTTSTAAAWTAGQRLSCTTACVFSTDVTGSVVVVAHAAAAATAAATTGDVILCLPESVSP